VDFPDCFGTVRTPILAPVVAGKAAKVAWFVIG
jgi:hypothetical protein